MEEWIGEQHKQEEQASTGNLGIGSGGGMWSEVLDIVSRLMDKGFLAGAQEMLGDVRVMMKEFQDELEVAGDDKQRHGEVIARFEQRLTEEFGVKKADPKDIAADLASDFTESALSREQELYEEIEMRLTTYAAIDSDIRLKVFFDENKGRNMVVVDYGEKLESPEVNPNYRIYASRWPEEMLEKVVKKFEDTGHSLSELVKGSEVAILGPGPGLIEVRALLQIEPEIQTIHVVELDRGNFLRIFKEWLALSPAERQRIRLHRADICSMPFNSGTLAMIYAAGTGTDVLGREKTIELLREMYRVLMPNAAVLGRIKLSWIHHVSEVLRDIGFNTDGIDEDHLYYAQKLSLSDESVVNELYQEAYGPLVKVRDGYRRLITEVQDKEDMNWAKVGVISHEIMKELEVVQIALDRTLERSIIAGTEELQLEIGAFSIGLNRARSDMKDVMDEYYTADRTRTRWAIIRFSVIPERIDSLLELLTSGQMIPSREIEGRPLIYDERVLNLFIAKHELGNIVGLLFLDIRELTKRCLDVENVEQIEEAVHLENRLWRSDFHLQEHIEKIRRGDYDLDKIADEVRTTLEEMHGIVKEMEVFVTSISDSISDKTFVERLLREIGKADRLFTGFISGKMTLELDQVDLGTVLSEVYSSFRKRWRKQGREDLVIVEDLPHELMVVVDEIKMDRAIFNLINNASEAMPDGGKITVSAKLTEDGIVICVSDTGRGMPQEAIDNFRQGIAGFSIKPRERGIVHGLGLYIVWSTIKAHNGTIDVESEPDRGTTFTITLPAQLVETKPEMVSVEPVDAGDVEAARVALERAMERERLAEDKDPNMALLTQVREYLMEEWTIVAAAVVQERDPSEIQAKLESFLRAIVDAESMLPETARSVLRDGLQNFWGLELLSRVEQARFIDPKTIQRHTAYIAGIDDPSTPVGARLLMELQSPDAVREGIREAQRRMDEEKIKELAVEGELDKAQRLAQLILEEEPDNVAAQQLIYLVEAINAVEGARDAVELTLDENGELALVFTELHLYPGETILCNLPGPDVSKQEVVRTARQKVDALRERMSLLDSHIREWNERIASMEVTDLDEVRTELTRIRDECASVNDFYNSITPGGISYFRSTSEYRAFYLIDWLFSHFWGNYFSPTFSDVSDFTEAIMTREMTIEEVLSQLEAWHVAFDEVIGLIDERLVASLDSSEPKRLVSDLLEAIREDRTKRIKPEGERLASFGDMLLASEQDTLALVLYMVADRFYPEQDFISFVLDRRGYRRLSDALSQQGASYGLDGVFVEVPRGRILAQALHDLGWVQDRVSERTTDKGRRFHSVSLVRRKINTVGFRATYVLNETEAFLEEVDELLEDEQIPVIMAENIAQERNLRSIARIREKVDGKEMFIINLNRRRQAHEQWQQLVGDANSYNFRNIEDVTKNMQLIHALATAK